MADTVEVFDDGHRSFPGDSFDKRASAAGDSDIDELSEFKEFTDELAVGCLDELNGMRGQTAFCEGSGDDGRQCAVGVKRFPAATEDHRIAALEAKCSCIDGDIGA